MIFKDDETFSIAFDIQVKHVNIITVIKTLDGSRGGAAVTFRQRLHDRKTSGRTEGGTFGGWNWQHLEAECFRKRPDPLQP